MAFLLAGLGNVGAQYELTRHNIGFLAADELADELGCSFSLQRHAYVAEGSSRGKKIILIKPTTFMNLSGQAVRYWMQQFKIPVSNLLVITDDLAIDFGKIRLRSKGSAGGHNGLKDIEATLATQEYARLRMGIGANFGKGQQVNYVLGQYSKDEMDALPIILDKAKQASLSFCHEGLANAMNKYNS